ncbi:MAG: hypothetical protein NTZ60_04435 [Campylobacterales bacterium]|nr:hypothetical protein [Campylobacterales bacterium]
MKNLLLSFSILITFSSFACSGELAKTGDFPKQEMKSQNKDIVKQVVSEISKSLPQTIDKYTKFVDIQAKDLTLLYTFEINTGAKSDDAVKSEDKSRMQKAVVTGICQSSSKFLEAGINTSYIYISTKTKAHLFQFDVTQKDCIKPIS